MGQHGGESAGDPLREAFVAACCGRVEHRSMPPDVRAAYCACVHDAAVDGLPDAEHALVRFYLTAQVGLGARGALGPGPPDLEAMGRASEAIERAVAQCKASRQRGLE